MLYLNTRFLIALIAGSLITLASGIILNPNSQVQALSNPSNSPLLAGVWDQSRETYSGNTQITVYRSPSCGCCGEWIQHIKKHGFQVTDLKIDDLETLKQEKGLPLDLASCHTAIIDGYIMEGHIPADDIKRFLKEKPNMLGLSVPAMPIGSPGMESGNRKQPFEVLSFGKDGKIEVFNTYQDY